MRCEGEGGGGGQPVFNCADQRPSIDSQGSLAKQQGSGAPVVKYREYWAETFVASHEVLPEERRSKNKIKKSEKENFHDDILLSKAQEVGGC